MEAIIIRAFTKEDREDVRRISWETAFVEQGKSFIDDQEVLADALTRYYTDYEPESCFVAVLNGKVAGYLIGSKDVVLAGKIFLGRVLFPLFLKALRQGLFVRKNNLSFLWNVILSALKGEFYSPDFSKQYPATLHINIDQCFRGQRVGTKLIERYIKYLKENKVAGLYFRVMSEGAKEFFIKSGFKLLYESRQSYLRYRIGKVVPCYIFGKKL